MFKPHLSTDVKRRLATNKTDFALIPGGLTSVLQPLDVCLNKPFKGHMREQWIEWFTSAEKTFTKAGNMQMNGNMENELHKLDLEEDELAGLDKKTF